MSYCICATTRPKSGTKRPKTQASLNRRSAISGSFGDVSMSRKRRFASGSARRSRSTRRRFWVISRRLAGWMARAFRCATSKMRSMSTGGCCNASSLRKARPPGATPEALDLLADQAEVGQAKAGLALRRLERGAEDARQVADALGDQEVVLHQPFDALAAGVVGIAEAARQLRLQVEREPFFRPADEV